MAPFCFGHCDVCQQKRQLNYGLVTDEQGEKCFTLTCAECGTLVDQLEPGLTMPEINHPALHKVGDWTPSDTGIIIVTFNDKAL